jgi:hypothetical protein
MGCFDSFFARCAKCGNEVEIQTKDFDSCCMTFHRGDTVYLSEAPDNFRLEDIHGGCHHCKYINTVIVEDNVFKGFI